jgi:hypothetical protein
MKMPYYRSSAENDNDNGDGNNAFVAAASGTENDDVVVDVALQFGSRRTTATMIVSWLHALMTMPFYFNYV